MRTVASIGLLALFIALAPMPAIAQSGPEIPSTWYFTDRSSFEMSVALEMDNDAPEGDTSSQIAVPAADQDEFAWVTATPARADLIFIAPADVTLYFGAGIDLGTTTTVKLLLIGPDGSQSPLGEDQATGTLATAGSVQTFSFDTNGTIVREGTWAALRINVEGATGAIQIDYGSPAAPSALATELMLLDTDGDGAHDAQERRAGTDPRDATEYPGSVDSDDDGLGDEWEEENFGDLSQGPTGDADGDGTSNFQQFVEDTRTRGGDGSDYLEAILGTVFLLAGAVLVAFGLLRRFPA